MARQVKGDDLATSGEIRRLAQPIRLVAGPAVNEDNGRLPVACHGVSDLRTVNGCCDGWTVLGCRGDRAQQNKESRAGRVTRPVQHLRCQLSVHRFTRFATPDYLRLGRPPSQRLTPRTSESYAASTRANHFEPRILARDSRARQTRVFTEAHFMGS